MRSKTLLYPAILMTSIMGIGLQSAVAAKGGTDILHYTVSTHISGEGEGHVLASLKEQGNAAHQTLVIDVQKLAPDTTYLLQAWLTGETNATDVLEFTTDSAGTAELSYKKNGALKSKGGGQGGGNSLPGVLDPVTGVLALDIVNASTQVVASANLAEPDQFQYLVKRGLDNDGVIEDASGSLRLKGHPNTQQFRLRADGLLADTDYLLAINTNIVSTLTSDSQGRINSKDLPNGSPNVLDIWSVELLNGETNSVLSTTLP